MFFLQDLNLVLHDLSLVDIILENYLNFFVLLMDNYMELFLLSLKLLLIRILLIVHVGVIFNLQIVDLLLQLIDIVSLVIDVHL